jgi:IS5 family transposase
MYRKTENQLPLENFHLPFDGKLRNDNRWVRLSQIIPWGVLEEKYAKQFTKSGMGAPAKPVRIALGALIIKEKCGFTDEETVEQIRENHYFQYFIGLPAYRDEKPFDPSMMVYFRKRLGAKILQEVNELICGTPANSEAQAIEKDDDDDDKPSDSSSKTKNQGHLILDATCAPADIRYPTDLSLLNEAREKLEAIIDILYEALPAPPKRKPRSYRIKARKDFLKAAKTRKITKKAIYKAIGKQLRYVKRDLKTIDDLLKQAPQETLKLRQEKNLETIRELYQQQQTMHQTGIPRIENRIVSISQPHVRPIVRGKASAETEFGAKLSISLVNGFARVETLRWDNYNEGIELIQHAKAFRSRYGFYPEAICADKIFRNRDSLRFCKKYGIRLSGPRLGRPNENELKAQKSLARKDSRIRNAVEGKFGEGKRRYGLARIMAKLPETSESVIMLQFLVMNLEHKLRVLLYQFFKVLFWGYSNIEFRNNCIPYASFAWLVSIIAQPKRSNGANSLPKRG